MVYLAQHRIIHRDLTAKNVMMTSKLMVKVKCTHLCRVLPQGQNSIYVGQVVGEDLQMKW